MPKQLAFGALPLALAGAVLVPENPFELAGRAARTGPVGQFNYLAPLLQLQQARATYAADPSQADIYWQAAATYASFVGEPDSVAHYWRQLGDAVPSPAAPAGPAEAALPAAAPAILAATAGRPLVLFNEEHTQPRGRWLVGCLLPALWRQGFRVLALEALEAADTAGVRQRGFAATASGFYTNEPHFGNLVRRARHLGFRVVAYDAYGADRELAEARNLVAATGLPASRARVVVLAGHGHISEAATEPRMAYYLHQLTGLDPLTIDQTQAAETSRLAWQKLPPGAYVMPAASLPHRMVACDVYVLNRLAVREAGNAWGTPTTIRVPANSLRPGQPHVVQVYAQAEYQRRPDAVPVAVRCLWPGQAGSRLALAPGRHVALVHDEAGRRCWQQRLLVGTN